MTTINAIYMWVHDLETGERAFVANHAITAVVPIMALCSPGRSQAKYAEGSRIFLGDGQFDVKESVQKIHEMMVERIEP